MDFRNGRVLMSADMEKIDQTLLIKKQLRDLKFELDNYCFSLLNLMYFLNKINIRLRIWFQWVNFYFKLCYLIYSKFVKAVIFFLKKP